MSALETVPGKQLFTEQPVGLNSQQNQEAVDLRENVGRSVDRAYDNADSRRRNPSVTDFWLDDYLDHRRVQRANKKARKHYEANAPAYHEQAMKEAKADGHEITFRGGVATNVKRLPERRAKRDKEAALNWAVGLGVIGAMLGTGYGLREAGITHGPKQTPAEQPASTHPDSNKSSEMPSTAHLKKFAAEKGVVLNQK